MFGLCIYGRNNNLYSNLRLISRGSPFGENEKQGIKEQYKSREPKKQYVHWHTVERKKESTEGISQRTFLINRKNNEMF